MDTNIITLYHYDGDEMREASYRLFDTHPAIDARPRHPVQARLHGLTLEDAPEHGGPVLVDDTGMVWSIDNALAMGKLTIIG